jgi:hypothetical protein
VTRTGLDSHHIAFLQVKFIYVVVITFPGMLELYLHEVGGVHVARDIGQPVIGIELSVLPAYGLVTQASVASHHYG